VSEPNQNQPPTPAPGATPPAPPIAWLPEADADTVGYVQNKGWQSPADTLSGYRNLEKMLGAEKAGRTVVLPSEDSPDAWAPVYEKLGRPKDPDGYGIKPAEGADPAFTKAMQTAFHEAGLSTKQAAKLAAVYEQFGTTHQQAAAEAEAQAFKAEQEALARDWGSELAPRTEIARRAAKELGMTDEQIGALEKAAGYSGVLKVFAKIGDTLFREAGLEGSGKMPGSFSMTPEGARTKKAQLLADADFRKRASVPNSAEWAQLTEINKILAAV